MALLEDGVWQGKVWTGAWTDGSGGTYAAVEPATGAELARMELRIVLPALFRRFPDLALAVPQRELSFRELSFVYGLDELPVRF